MIQRIIDGGVRLPQDTILFGVSKLNDILLENRFAPIWRREDLTSDAAILARFVEEVTRGHVEVEVEWAARAIRMPPTNRHRIAMSEVRSFEPWQIEAINKIVAPEAWRLYEQLGYKRPNFLEAAPPSCAGSN